MILGPLAKDLSAEARTRLAANFAASTPGTSAGQEGKRAGWRGSRGTDPGGAMRVIAGNLSEADIDALAAYFASLRPPY